MLKLNAKYDITNNLDRQGVDKSLSNILLFVITGNSDELEALNRALKGKNIKFSMYRERDSKEKNCLVLLSPTDKAFLSLKDSKHNANSFIYDMKTTHAVIVDDVVLIETISKLNINDFPIDESHIMTKLAHMVSFDIQPASSFPNMVVPSARLKIMKTDITEFFNDKASDQVEKITNDRIYLIEPTDLLSDIPAIKTSFDTLGVSHSEFTINLSNKSLGKKSLLVFKTELDKLNGEIRHTNAKFVYDLELTTCNNEDLEQKLLPSIGRLEAAIKRIVDKIASNKKRQIVVSQLTSNANGSPSLFSPTTTTHSSPTTTDYISEFYRSFGSIFGNPANSSGYPKETISNTMVPQEEFSKIDITEFYNQIISNNPFGKIENDTLYFIESKLPASMEALAGSLRSEKVTYRQFTPNGSSTMGFLVLKSVLNKPVEKLKNTTTKTDILRALPVLTPSIDELKNRFDSKNKLFVAVADYQEKINKAKHSADELKMINSRTLPQPIPLDVNTFSSPFSNQQATSFFPNFALVSTGAPSFGTVSNPNVGSAMFSLNSKHPSENPSGDSDKSAINSNQTGDIKWDFARQHKKRKQ